MRTSGPSSVQTDSSNIPFPELEANVSHREIASVQRTGELRESYSSESVSLQVSSGRPTLNSYHCCSPIAPHIDALNNVNTSPVFFYSSPRQKSSSSLSSVEDFLALLATQCFALTANLASFKRTFDSSSERLGWVRSSFHRMMDFLPVKVSAHVGRSEEVVLNLF